MSQLTRTVRKLSPTRFICTLTGFNRSIVYSSTDREVYAIDSESGQRLYTIAENKDYGFEEFATITNEVYLDLIQRN